MGCITCKSTRLCHIISKSSDNNFIEIGDKNDVGYVPDDMGIGGNDEVNFTYCLDCGQIQGKKFPLPMTELELMEGDEYDENEENFETIANIEEWAKYWNVSLEEAREIIAFEEQREK